VVLLDAAPPEFAGGPPLEGDAVAAAAQAAGADAVSAARMQRSVQRAQAHRFGVLPGAVGVIRARDTAGRGTGPDLGWAGIFAQTETADVPGTHDALLSGGDLAGLCGRIERMWSAQGPEATVSGGTPGD
jgi:thioesterase domain-containing protein